jgi:predicted Zn-dependent peptidase
VKQKIHQTVLSNGLRLVAERLDHVHTAAFQFLIPAGSMADPAGKRGVANILSDLMTRGAGKRDNREFNAAMDRLGVDFSTSAGVLNLRLAGSCLAENLEPALDLFSDMILRPILPEKELAPVLDLAAQDIRSTEDSPRKMVMLEVRKHHFPAPLGLDPRGDAESLGKIDIETLKSFHAKRVQPRDAILSVAGRIDLDQVQGLAERFFGEWEPGTPPVLKEKVTAKKPGRAHIHKDTEQVHIGLAYPAVSVAHPDYFAALGMVQVLSGGMSSRLFGEIREKRGLCYSIWTTLSPLKHTGAILGYAGTTAARAQETLDLFLLELARVGEGVEEDEVKRVQVGLETSLLMQEDSSGARSNSLASDVYNLGRVRPIEELREGIASITRKKIADYARRNPPQPLTVATIGPAKLKIS